MGSSSLLLASTQGSRTAIQCHRAESTGPGEYDSSFCLLFVW